MRKESPASVFSQIIPHFYNLYIKNKKNNDNEMKVYNLNNGQNMKCSFKWIKIQHCSLRNK